MRGCARPGRLYLDEYGVPKDSTKVRILFQKACDAGGQQGYVALSVCNNQESGLQDVFLSEDSLLLLLSRFVMMLRIVFCWSRKMSMQLSTQACPNCGAPLSFSLHNPIQECPFCNTKIVVEQDSSAGRVIEAEFQIREFRVTQEVFHQKIMEWLIEGDYVPDDILTQSQMHDYTGVFLPFYRLTGEIRGEFSADVGHNRQESYRKKVLQPDGSYKEERRTKTVVDWRPQKGEASEQYNIWLCASEKIHPNLVSFVEERAENLELPERSASEEVVGGFAFENFNFQVTEAEERSKERFDELMESKAKSYLQGDKLRKLRYSYDRQNTEHKKVYQPFWIATFSYKGKQYPFVLCGTDEKQRSGEKPVDEDRQSQVKEFYKTFKLVSIIGIVISVLSFCAFPLPIITIPITILAMWHFRKEAKGKEEELLGQSRAFRQKMLQKKKAERLGEQEE